MSRDLHTDDEDSSFGNNHDPSSTWSPDVNISGYVYETQGQARPNSELNIDKVRDVPCTTPCLLSASWYDGANCFVASPPAGTTPFVYGGNLYYSAQSVPTCPLPGSGYDGANRFVATPPAGTTPWMPRCAACVRRTCAHAERGPPAGAWALRERDIVLG